MDKAVGALDVCLDNLRSLTDGNNLVNFAYFHAQSLSIHGGECVARKAGHLKMKNPIRISQLP